MQITLELLEKIAHLARLQIAPEDRAQLLDNLNKIVAWVNQLQEVDTTGIEPLTHMTNEINRLRPDVAEQTLSRERALSQAPVHDTDYFHVPKVID